jgi:hypothetical protein
MQYWHGLGYFKRVEGRVLAIVREKYVHYLCISCYHILINIYEKVQKSQKELLGRTNRLLSLIRHGSHRKRRVH